MPSVPLHSKIIQQKKLAKLEFWTSFLIFLILLSGTLLFWLLAFTEENEAASELFALLLVGGVIFDCIIFWLLYNLASSRRRTIEALEEVEKKLKNRFALQNATIESTKDDFVTLASHQLRTPLSTIRWYAELLMHGQFGALSAQQKKAVLHVSESCERMIHLVNSLLNISRIELGRFRIDPQPCRISDTVNRALDDNRASIAEKKLAVKTRYGASARMITTDPKLLFIVVENLISNAVAYTPAGGSIAISSAAKGNAISLTVTDTGMGIPSRQQRKLFTKFFRGDNVRAADTTGSGLGLHIVKSILAQIDGEISFASKEGDGTTFTVTLPHNAKKRRKGAEIFS